MRKKGSLLSLTRSPHCRINRTEKGAADGVLGASGSRCSPDRSWLALKIKPVMFLWEGRGSVQLTASGRAMGSGLFQQGCPHALGRGGWLDSVCTQCMKRI